MATYVSYVGYLPIMGAYQKANAGLDPLFFAAMPEASGYVFYTVYVSPNAIPDGYPNVVYSQFFLAGGGFSGGGYIYTISSGALPNGLALNETTGELSGTPTTLGTYTFHVRATDINGKYGERAYIMRVVVDMSTADPYGLLPTVLPDGNVDTPYSQVVVGYNGVPPYAYEVVDGIIPFGLSFNETTGELTGIPTNASTYNLVIKVTDSDTPPKEAYRAYTIIIGQPLGAGGLMTYTM